MKIRFALGLLRPGVVRHSGGYCLGVPAIGGVRPAASFALHLDDPRTGARLRHAYVVESLPVVA